MVALSVAIMAVPERLRLVGRLQEALCPLPREVLAVSVEWDARHAGPAACARRAWLRVHPAASHHLVLQDDVVVCRDFLQTCLELCRVQPDSVLTLFTQRKVVDAARAQGVAWARVHEPIMAQAYILPRHLIYPFVHWERAHVQPGCRDDDVRLALWLHALGSDAYATAPSLVDHADQGTSVMKHPHAPGGRPRAAKWFIGADVSGLSVDWTAGLADRRALPRDGKGPDPKMRALLRP